MEKDYTNPMMDTKSNGVVPDGGKGMPKRENWTRKIDFLFACIGFSVGLGNVWRFPYLCYKNGGGAFLLPYLLFCVLAGIPLFYLEVSLGQFMSEGGIAAWKICPLLQGIGFATTIVVFILNVYYNIILTWSFYYLFSSFTSVLPWSHCDNSWNTPNCSERATLGNMTNMTDVTVVNMTGMAVGNIMNITGGAGLYDNMTENMVNVSAVKMVDPVTEFWQNKVLAISSGIDDPGVIKWDLALCLLLAWIVVYLCICKGIKSSAKVLYVTATAPYLLLTILLIRGLTLPGAWEGVKFYVVPDFSKLSQPQVWMDAGTQIVFTFSISVGTLTALGSYNKFHHNSYKDTIIFAMMNCGTSFFSGFVIFSVLGFMADLQGVSVGKVAESGPGLAFIAYPKAVSQMPLAPVWSVLFFLMIISVGIDSQIVQVEGFITAVVDMFPVTLRPGYRRQIFIISVCVTSFFLGLSMVTNGGMYVFQLFDYYSGSRIILLIAFFECVAVAWIYGIRRYYDNVEMMLGYRLGPFMKICWSIITPMFTLGLFVMCIYFYTDLQYNRVYVYPRWAIGIGWSLASCSVIMIPIIMAVKLITAQGTIQQRFRNLVRPQLQPHQLRDCDNPKDLMDYQQHMALKC